MIFYNENNEIIKHNIYEKTEQNLVNKYINEDDIVLELGARYGTVSCLINSKLNSEGKFKKSILISNTFCIPIAIFILS